MLTIPLCALSLIGMYLVSKMKRIGWLVGILSGFTWIAYGIYTHQWGLVISSVVTGVVQVRAWWEWGRPEIQEGDG